MLQIHLVEAENTNIEPTPSHEHLNVLRDFPAFLQAFKPVKALLLLVTALVVQHSADFFNFATFYAVYAYVGDLWFNFAAYSSAE